MYESLEVCYLDEPFKLSIKDFPLNKVYVIDDWLSKELHLKYFERTSQPKIWAQNNQVQSEGGTGLPYHLFWGSTFLRDGQIRDGGLNPIDCFFTEYLNDRLQTEFGFEWVRFDYAGMNGQTQGLHGTIHSDCQNDDSYNISFLYYTNPYWNPHWGGQLRFYNDFNYGKNGEDDWSKEHQSAEVDFKPNRLLMFDGRIPHGADAPLPRAKYMCRQSLVIRGSEAQLCQQ